MNIGEKIENPYFIINNNEKYLENYSDIYILCRKNGRDNIDNNIIFSKYIKKTDIKYIIDNYCLIKINNEFIENTKFYDLSIFIKGYELNSIIKNNNVENNNIYILTVFAYLDENQVNIINDCYNNNFDICNILYIIDFIKYCSMDLNYVFLNYVWK